MELNLKQYKANGVLINKYQPLHNLLKLNKKGEKLISDFRSAKLPFTPKQSVDISCQPSYDGTVNLIINDNETVPKIINSKFTKKEDNQFEIITRNQKNQTNIYDEEKLESDTSLFLTSTIFPKVHLYSVGYNGQLMGGNYTFYIKYCDDDYNETNIIAESGQISIFKGTINNPKTISGTIYNERTDKSITLKLTNLDTAYNKLKLYYSRSSCDSNGFLLQTIEEIDKPYNISDSEMKVVITGFEETNAITVDELNVINDVVSSVKTQAQVQNILFFGNVEKKIPNNKDLASISYYIKVKPNEADNIGNLAYDYTIDSSQNHSIENTEYYNPKNLYYYLGYWPGEMYRLGVVYVMEDGSLTDVYNLRGCDFNKRSSNYDDISYNELYLDSTGKQYEVGIYNDSNDGELKLLYNSDGTPLYRMHGSYVIYKTVDGKEIKKSSLCVPNIISNAELAAKYGNLYTDSSKTKINYIDEELIQSDLTNTFGVFKNKKDYNVIQDNGVHPLGYSAFVPNDVIQELKNQGIIGLFFVRQKRLANILGQGLSIGILKDIYTPLMYDDTSQNYITESFVGKYQSTSSNDGKLDGKFAARKREYSKNYVSSYGLLSLDAIIKPELQSTYDGSEFLLKKQGDVKINNNDGYFYQTAYKPIKNGEDVKTQVLYIPGENPVKVMEDLGFSTKVGSEESVYHFGMFNNESGYDSVTDVFRGNYTPFLGTTSKSLSPNCLYNITRSNYSELYDSEYIKIRGNDLSPFYSISDRYGLDELSNSIPIFRGDCFSNTITMRINRNFVDPDVPISDSIIDYNTWKDNYHGYLNIASTADEDDDKTHFENINRGDLNNISLGMWITFKCLSNYNLGLRAIDGSHVDEFALLGNERAFYPVRSRSRKSSCKVPDSSLLNAGYSSTVGMRDNFKWNDVPYNLNIFDNRVMFSNASSVDNFKNGYRIFQGLSYQDIDRQYGAIVKLFPWNRNLLCVFEHGVGILPINEYALQSTTSGQSIHLFGEGVLSKNVTTISQDFGSIWKDSLIPTPKGVYGVDTYAKKIWRVGIGDNKMETISDVKIQRFLNEHIKLAESDAFPSLAIKNVATHYNNFKGDVMFTFYNMENKELWNLCYNERQGKWTTRYSWIPLFSQNINNQFYSFDQKRSEIYSIIYNNKHTENGVLTSDQILEGYDDDKPILNEITLSLGGFDVVTMMKVKINSVETSYLDNNDTEHTIYIPEDLISEILSIKYNGDRTNLLNVNFEVLNDWFKETSGYDDVPVYLKINVSTTLFIDDAVVATTFNDVLGFLINPRKDGPSILQKDKLLRNAFFVHGRAGIFDEINYEDASFDNQILPCKWYNKQEPFEFEFVVNGDELGYHKIFNNLVIISNNVQPNELEMEVIGDVYELNKQGIFRASAFGEDEFNSAKEKMLNGVPYKISQEIQNGVIKWDNNANQYSVCISQPTYNIKEYGRIKGNIHYKEDSWYVTLDPVKYKKKYLIKDEIKKESSIETPRLRDKYIKIRVKYTGESLVIITALRTLYTLSYA